MKPRLRKKCWAEDYGGCKGKLSREHVISKSILELVDTTLSSRKNQGKVGKGSYVLKYLCESHNRRLSIYDDEAFRLYNGFRSLYSQDEDFGVNVISENYGELIIDKCKLERWFAKTFLNVTIFDAIAIESEYPPPYNPSGHSIAAKLFNDEPFVPPFGIYVIKPGKQRLQTPQGKIQYVIIGKGMRIKKNGVFSGPFYAPNYICINFMGMEIVGLFNIIAASDEFILKGALKSSVAELSSIAKYIDKNTPVDFHGKRGGKDNHLRILFR